MAKNNNINNGKQSRGSILKNASDKSLPPTQQKPPTLTTKPSKSSK